jgi:hypothetical protein
LSLELPALPLVDELALVLVLAVEPLAVAAVLDAVVAESAAVEVELAEDPDCPATA